MKELAERLVFPAGRGFIPVPIRRTLLHFLEQQSPRDQSLLACVYRNPPDPLVPARSWQISSARAWMRLEAALSGAAPATSAQDWLARHGEGDSPAETAFVEKVIAPALGEAGLRVLRSQEVFTLPNGGDGRIDFVLELGGIRIAIEVDGIAYHEGPGPDGQRPEAERDRQNAIIAAGYDLLRYTGREILKKPEDVVRRLQRDLKALGVTEGEQRGLRNDPLPLSSTTYAMLGPWPRQFVRAQMSTLNLFLGHPEWLRREAMTVLFPRSERGAMVLGFLDVLDAWESAARLSGVSGRRRRLRLWVGDHRETVKQLLQARVGAAESGQLPFDVELLSETIPKKADLLFVSAESDIELEPAKLDILVRGLARDALVLWSTEIDASVPKLMSSHPRYYESLDRGVVEHLLERFFGFSSFREGQWEIVEGLLKGESLLGVLPTGAGKTVCFQLPALLQPGLSLVVSPLVSLMDDQVANLRANGLDFAGRAHSKLSMEEKEEEAHRFRSGQFKLYYISPERFHSNTFHSELEGLLEASGQPIAYFVVDEAHLASEWGHDFRPSYLTLPEAHRSLCPTAPIALLTATAPRQIRSDLMSLFDQKKPLRAVLPPTFDRPELSFAVESVKNDTEREQKLVHLLRSSIPKSLGFEDFSDLHQTEEQVDRVHFGGLIFTPWGKPGHSRPAIRAAEVVTMLKTKGFPVEDYRSTQSTGESRDRTALNRMTQERFKRNELPLVVATKGFGTGIDKPDVRYVVHADMPGSLESLYQEAGRAGRDGQDARGVMLWRPREEGCRPEGKPPACTGQRMCPFGLEEDCSFGVQAKLRSSNQPGAQREIETSLTLWRRYFRKHLDRKRVLLPRHPRVYAVERRELLDNTENLVHNLYRLGLCGVPSVPRDSKKPIFVKNIPFEENDLRMRVKKLAPTAPPLGGRSASSLIAAAVQAVFETSPSKALDHAAIWSMYLENRQYNSKKTAVHRASSQNTQKQQDPGVERFLARLVTLGVVKSYRYEGDRQWGATLCKPASRKSKRLMSSLRAAVMRHNGTLPPSLLLSKGWEVAVEEALAHLVQSWYQTIAVRSWETLESLEEYAAAKDCRRKRIAQYMNESAVAIPSPCGHCDNCGIELLDDLHPVTMDKALERRVAAFNTAFDRILDAPDEIEEVEALVQRGIDEDQLGAIRDRCARHLERSPYDLGPRLAAARAAFLLEEERVAERHLRMLLEALRKRADRSLLERGLERIPKVMLGLVLDDLEGYLMMFSEEERQLYMYTLEYSLSYTRAATRGAAMIHKAASGFLPSPQHSRRSG